MTHHCTLDQGPLPIWRSLQLAMMVSSTNYPTITTNFRLTIYPSKSIHSCTICQGGSKDKEMAIPRSPYCQATSVDSIPVSSGSQPISPFTSAADVFNVDILSGCPIEHMKQSIPIPLLQRRDCSSCQQPIRFVLIPSTWPNSTDKHTTKLHCFVERPKMESLSFVNKQRI